MLASAISHHVAAFSAHVGLRIYCIASTCSELLATGCRSLPSVFVAIPVLENAGLLGLSLLLARE